VDACVCVGVGFLGDFLVGAWGSCGRGGEETDGFESGFVEFEDSGDIFGFFGFEGDGGADLVVAQ